jgi:hypothetical protein
LTIESLKYLPPELVIMRTMRPLATVQRMEDTTVPKENSHRIPTVPGHQLEDLLRAATVPATPVEAAAPLVTVTPAMEALAAGAPDTGLAGEPTTEAIAEDEATQTATSPVSHAAATMPAAESKKYDAKSPPRQATATTSPPSPLHFTISFS